MSHALRADRLLIKPTSGRQAGTGFLARTNRSKDSRQGHPYAESQTRNTGTQPDKSPRQALQHSHSPLRLVREGVPQGALVPLRKVGVTPPPLQSRIAGKSARTKTMLPWGRCGRGTTATGFHRASVRKHQGVGKQMEGDNRYRRKLARLARTPGKRPSELGVSIGALKQREHEERDGRHEVRVARRRQGKLASAFWRLGRH
jgi:hypothetical protein